MTLVEWLSVELPIIKTWKELLLRGAERYGFTEEQAHGVMVTWEKGYVEGCRGTTQMVLEARFGSLPHWAMVKLNEAGRVQLEIWAKNCGDADNLALLIHNRLPRKPESPMPR